MNTWLDDRGFSYMDIFSGTSMEGQVNYSVVNPGVIKAWHRHKHQTDYWMIVSGDAKIGLYDQDKGPRNGCGPEGPGRRYHDIACKPC